MYIITKLYCSYPVADLGGVGGVQMNPPLELVIVTFASRATISLNPPF